MFSYNNCCNKKLIAKKQFLLVPNDEKIRIKIPKISNSVDEYFRELLVINNTIEFDAFEVLKSKVIFDARLIKNIVYKTELLPKCDEPNKKNCSNNVNELFSGLVRNTTVEIPFNGFIDVRGLDTCHNINLDYEIEGSLTIPKIGEIVYIKNYCYNPWKFNIIDKTAVIIKVLL